MINSMLAHYDQSVDHLLPMWSLQGNETWCMIGYHAVPVIADGLSERRERIRSPQRAYEAIKTTAMNPDYDSVAAYAQAGLGAVRQGKRIASPRRSNTPTTTTASRRWPRRWAKQDDYDYFMKRAGSYKNIYDPSIGLMRGKDSRRPLAHAVRSACVCCKAAISPKARAGNIPGMCRRMCPA